MSKPGSVRASVRDHEERTLEVDDSVASLGFGFLHLPPTRRSPLVIKTVKKDKGLPRCPARLEDSWADLQGVVPGTELLELDGEEAGCLTPEHFREALQRRPLRLKLAPPYGEVWKQVAHFQQQPLVDGNLAKAMAHSNELEQRARQLQAHFQQAQKGMMEINRLCDQADNTIIQGQVLLNRSAHRLHELNERLQQLQPSGVPESPPVSKAKPNATVRRPSSSRSSLRVVALSLQKVHLQQALKDESDRVMRELGICTELEKSNSLQHKAKLLKDQAQQLQEKRDLEEEVERLQVELETSHAELASERQQLEEERNRWQAELEESHRRLASEQQSMEDERKDLEAKLDTATASWSSQKERMEEEKSEMQASISELQAELQRCKAELAAWTMSFGGEMSAVTAQSEEFRSAAEFKQAELEAEKLRCSAEREESEVLRRKLQDTWGLNKPRGPRRGNYATIDDMIYQDAHVQEVNAELSKVRLQLASTRPSLEALLAELATPELFKVESPAPVSATTGLGPGVTPAARRSFQRRSLVPAEPEKAMPSFLMPPAPNGARAYALRGHTDTRVEAAELASALPVALGAGLMLALTLLVPATNRYEAKDCQGPASHIARDIQRDEAVFVRHNEERLGQVRQKLREHAKVAVDRRLCLEFDIDPASHRSPDHVRSRSNSYDHVQARVDTNLSQSAKSSPRSGRSASRLRSQPCNYDHVKAKDRSNQWRRRPLVTSVPRRVLGCFSLPQLGAMEPPLQRRVWTGQFRDTRQLDF
eukprot:g523.t1